MISLIGKLDRKVDWVEMYMERMIGSLGKLGRKVDIGRKMNDPDGVLDPWSCLYFKWSGFVLFFMGGESLYFLLDIFAFYL